MVCNFMKKKSSGTGKLCKFSEIFEKTFFVEHFWTDAWMKWAKKNCIHKIYLKENTGDGVLFSA